jgi:5-dehydro-2-deoxygluconokinase
LHYAGRHGVLRVLDIDYRPVLWGLTKRGEGANRFVADARVTASLQQMLPQFELLIGTEEEFLIAGGVPGDLLASLKRVREVTPAALVVKLGAKGCCFIDGAVPKRLEDAPTVVGERIEVFNVLGAGDAFAAGLMSGFLRGQGFEDAARTGNACGALVVSRHACAPAMPTPAELSHWFSGQRAPRVDSDPVLAHLHRTTAPRAAWPELCVMAFDHRSQFFEMAQAANAPLTRLPVLKRLLLDAARNAGAQGVLIDGRYGLDALAAATGSGLWLGRPVESPGSRPLAWDGTRSIASALVEWPREQVVKCLVHYHPDDDATLRVAQEERLLELWEATRTSGHELLLEVIAPQHSDEAVLRAVKRFYNLGLKPEWWKLAPMAGASWAALAALIDERDPYCRGAVILGLNQPLETLQAAFAQATHPVVKGFMVGRTIWGEASAAWLRGEIDDAALMQRCADRYGALLQAWRARKIGA